MAHVGPVPDKRSVPLVLCMGAGTTKFGRSGDDAPQVFESIVARRRRQPRLSVPLLPSMTGDSGSSMTRSMRGPRPSMPGAQGEDVFVGNAARDHLVILDNKRPIHFGPTTFSWGPTCSWGLTTDWNDVERIWHHMFFNELKVGPERHPVLLTEPPLNPKANREEMIKRMFDNFNVPAAYLALQPVLSLLASGRATGVVVDSGYGVSQVTPIYEGYAVTHAISSIGLAGRDVTDHLELALSRQGFQFTIPTEKAYVGHIKERECRVALDYTSEMRGDERRICQIDLEHSFTLDIECILCPEVLFQPRLAGKQFGGIHELVHGAIQRCDADMRSKLWNNIVLSGGTSMLPGFVERISKELTLSAPSAVMLKVVAPPDRMASAWIGGSMLSSMSCFEQMCISSKDFDEMGPSIVHQKCF